jgi:hypothetical protein
MGEGMLSRVWEDRWRIAACLAPALILVLFLNRVVLPLATSLRDVSGKVALLRENTYEASWLDSTQNALKHDVATLKAFHASREAALTSDASVQATVDRIRGLAQRSGVEITKTTPILSRAEPLRLLKIKMEGYARYSGLMDFFDSLAINHPDLFLEEMLVRQGGERSNGRLESNLILSVYDRKKGELP